jgi:hypothetical protein
MKKVIIGAAVVAAALGVMRRFGPAIHERAMNKCHQMMGKCQEMFSQRAGSAAGTACMSTATPGPEQESAEEHEGAETARAS